MFDVNTEAIPTPCYLLDEGRLNESLLSVKKLIEKTNIEVLLALKGFALYSVFPKMKPYLSGTSASSLFEARLGFELFGNSVSSYAPAYIPHDFSKILTYSKRITFNSLNEWNRYKNMGNKKMSYGLRINPEYSEVTFPMYNPCIKGSRLGILEEDIGKQLPKEIEGLHIHSLCEADAETLERTIYKLIERFDNLLHQVKWLNLGGGHLITKKDYNLPLLIDLVSMLSHKYGLQIIIEPGSGLVWEAGYLVASVLDIVKNKGTYIALLDTSFSAHMPDTLEVPYNPKILNFQEGEGNNKYTYLMGGITCMSGDQIGPYHFEKPLKVGDKIVFNDMMHYTMVKNTYFNGVQPPHIAMYTEDKKIEMIRVFNYNDYKNQLS